MTRLSLLNCCFCFGKRSAMRVKRSFANRSAAAPKLESRSCKSLATLGPTSQARRGMASQSPPVRRSGSQSVSSWGSTLRAIVTGWPLTEDGRVKKQERLAEIEDLLKVTLKVRVSSGLAEG